ncbi:MAG: hypothetical protein J2P49_06790 [Methylocapsa sp.]|nr:hypothetical protein [Methylocapsa sp.]
MSNFLAPGGWMGSDIRLNGIGWIGAMLVVGITIIAARLVVHWQLRRVEKTLSRQDKATSAEEKTPGEER